MVLDKKKLENEGYLSFNLKDVDDDLHNELHDNFIKSNSLSSINLLRYDCTIECDSKKFYFDDYCKKLKDEFNLVDDSFFEHYIIDKNKIRLTFKLKGEYESLSKCKTKIDNFEKNLKAQSWLYNSSYKDFKLNPIVEKIYKKILSNLYPEYVNENLYFENKINSFDLTLYEKNDFIEPHSDGINPERLCVILIYLNDDYQEGFGGELVIEKEVVVPPIFGNVAILDFVNNNPNHSVSIVLDDEFKRFAFIKFFYKEKTK